MTLATIAARSRAAPHAGLIATAVLRSTSTTNRSPHAAAQEVGLAGAGRTLLTSVKKAVNGARTTGRMHANAKKATIDGKSTLRRINTDTREHGVSKKLGGEHAAAKKDGTLRIRHHQEPRRTAGGLARGRHVQID